MKKIVVLLVALIAAAVQVSAAKDLKLTIKAKSPQFENPAREYRDIWKHDGERIKRTMKEISGLEFPVDHIVVEVYEGISSSGWGSRPMRMRASYPSAVKKATLIHELGHRLLGSAPHTRKFDEHRRLFLFLYDVWVKLYGKKFADEQVAVESRRRGVYDYESAWKWAIGKSFAERQNLLAELRTGREIQMAFEKFNAAFLAADRTVLEQMLTADYYHANGSGSVHNRSSWLKYIESRKAQLTSGELKVTRYDYRRLRINVYGDAAVLTADMYVTSERSGVTQDTAIRVTTVWNRERGKWKRSAFHDSRIPKKQGR